MTRADSWKKRDCVLRYWAYGDALKIAAINQNLTLPQEGAHVVFVLPMPSSWSQKKRDRMRESPHQQKPDIDNLLKAFLDKLLSEDKEVWDIRASKIWGEKGQIILYGNERS